MNAFASLLRAAHQLDASDVEWVEGLRSPAAELLDDGAGLLVHSYMVERDGASRPGPVSGDPSAPALWTAIEAWGARNRATIASIIGSGVGGFDGVVEIAKARNLPLSSPHETFEAHRIRDLVTIFAHSPSGYGLALISPRRHRSFSMARDGDLGSRLAGQLQVAVRLRARRRFQQTRVLSQRQDVVLRRLLSGASDKEIAAEFAIGLSTVSTYVRRLRGALGYGDGASAILAARTDSVDIARRRIVLLGQLTRSEQDIVCWLLEGASNREIALSRATSTRTVANQCTAILRKCSVKGRRELASAFLGSVPRSLSGK
jgi:DNA-binding CsgD family transcriptional regulator